MFFHPIVLAMMVILVVSVIILFFVVQIGIISYAFDKIGLPSEALFSLLLLSWVGSWVNIPLARLPAEPPVLEEGVIRVFGQRYMIPRWGQQRHIVLAVNVGGAVVPTLLSLYLLTQALAPLRVVLVTVAVTLLTYRLARPVAGVGIGRAHGAAPAQRGPGSPPPGAATSAVGSVCGRDDGYTHRWRPPARAPGDHVSHTSGLDWWCRHVRWSFSLGDYGGPAGLRRVQPL